jgi:hypothetical protein
MDRHSNAAPANISMKMLSLHRLDHETVSLTLHYA